MGLLPSMMARATSWGTRTPSSAPRAASLSSSSLLRSIRASYSLRVSVISFFFSHRLLSCGRPFAVGEGMGRLVTPNPPDLTPVVPS